MQHRMGSIDDTRIIGEAWAHATSLSADGQLQQAIMGFLRLRNILQDQNLKLQCFDAVPVGRDGLPVPAFRGTGAPVQAAATPTGARKGAGAVVDKLLSKVDEELRSHIRFLQSNPYAALQLPLPRGAGITHPDPTWEVTDTLVKNNYRRLALRFHPDKTGGTDSSPLFAAIRTAYETLATSRDRALYKAAPAGDAGAEFCWVVEVGAAPTRGSASGGGGGGGSGVARTASSQDCFRPAKKEGPRPWVSRNYCSLGSHGGLFGQKGGSGGNGADGFRHGQGAARKEARDRGDRGTHEGGDEPGSDDNEEHQQQEKGHTRQGYYARVGIDGQGGELDRRDYEGRRTEIDTEVPSVSPRHSKGHEKSQGPGQEHSGEVQGGQGGKDGGNLGGHVRRRAGVGAESFSRRSRPSNSSPAPFAGDGGACQPFPRFADRQKPPRQQPNDRPGEGNSGGGGVGDHRCRQTAASVRPASPQPPPSQPAAAATRAASCPRTTTRPYQETASLKGPEAVSVPPAEASNSGSSGSRTQKRGGRIVECSLFHGPLGDHDLDACSTLSNDTGSSGGGGAGGAGDDGGDAGGCVQRLRERVTTRARDQYHAATACTSPIYAYELQREVDFWVSGARREGVSRGRGSVDDGTAVQTSAVAEGSAPVSPGNNRESIQEALNLSRRGRRGGGSSPAEGGGDAVDGLVRAAVRGDEGRRGGGFRPIAASDGSSTGEQRTPTERAPHSFEKIEISTTTAAAAGAGRGWFWGAAT